MMKGIEIDKETNRLEERSELNTFARISRWRSAVEIDIYCHCGAVGLIYGKFFPVYTCLHCGKTYIVGTKLHLYELPKALADEYITKYPSETTVDPNYYHPNKDEKEL